MKKEYCVYMHTFPNGKVYIGQTKQKPQYRFSNGDGYKGCRYVYSAIQKYGWENIKHEILIDNLSREEADYWEDCFIILYRSSDRDHGYNLRSGGTSGYKYTDDVRQRMSEIQRGRKQTDETRKKHSDALRKYYSTHEVSQSTREKLSKANSGKKRQTLPPKLKEKAVRNIRGHQFEKGHAPNIKSMNTLREKFSKKVVQYDLNGNKIAEYSSITEASLQNNLSKNAVGNCVRGYVLTTNGYFWRYASDSFDIKQISKEQIAKSVKTCNRPKRVLKITTDGTVVGEYASISDAKRITGLCHIGEVLRGVRKTAGGYVWKYAE